jgi:hypothetical protein
MGRLVTIHPCANCNYHIEGELHEGGSGIATMFLRNRYALAICNDCHHLVSVLVANSEEETQDALKQARSEIVQMEADAVIGDKRARDLLPLFREALDSFDENVPPAITSCSMCGGSNVEIQTYTSGKNYDPENAWVQCPRCDEGRLFIEITGTWD